MIRMLCAICNKRDLYRCYKCKALFCIHCEGKIDCPKGRDHQVR